jgi:hypothetical protein
MNRNKHGYLHGSNLLLLAPTYYTCKDGNSDDADSGLQDAGVKDTGGWVLEVGYTPDTALPRLDVLAADKCSVPGAQLTSV